MEPKTTKTTKTTCPYCGVGCGILATKGADGRVEIEGDPDHPANYGRLRSKGTALGETLSLDDRVLEPVVDGKDTDWDSALDLVEQRFGDTIAEHGPDAVAFYVSGQMLTEDYYVANKLMKGFIGSGNIDTNSRLCMASSVAGHKRAFGADTVPGCYEDLELADVIVLVGSNLAWCHPVLYQRIAAAQETRASKIIVIDPRQTATSDAADLHLPLAPGSDVALFNGLLMHLHKMGAADEAYVAAHTSGLAGALAAAQSLDPAGIAEATSLDPADLQTFYELFAGTERVVTVYSQGVNQSTSGTDKVNAILNCHLLTGRIGRPGMGPFSVTGQPNAMGGREVGGLANQLACHMDIENPVHHALVSEFWDADRLTQTPGLKAVDLFQAVEAGHIKALWIMATNPVDSLPEADRVRAALDACPFVVVSDVTRHTDTTAHADVLLPAAAWGEKSGTVTNSERRISRQRSFLALPGAAQPDWWIIIQVAQRMGFGAAFPYEHPADIYKEYAELSGRDNNGARDFDISAHDAITLDEYEGLQPFQWPLSRHTESSARFFASGNYYTPDRRARFVAVRPAPPAQTVSDEFPLTLNTGRIRDQWHTMTRTGKAARLMQHRAEPFVEVNPVDAARYGVRPDDLATVRSPKGAVIVRVLITARQPRGTAFAPMHWSDQFASAARINTLVAAKIDDVSGQPEFKHTPVSLAPFNTTWHGLLLIRDKPDVLVGDYWSLAPAGDGWRIELAGQIAPDNWTTLARAMLKADNVPGSEMLAYHDASAGQHRFACFRNGELVGAFFVAGDPITVPRAWAATQLAADFSDPTARLRLLAGRAAGLERDPGPIVCACFEVGLNDILDAAINGGCANIDAIGAATNAGTNCGSCRIEIGRVLDETRVKKAS